MHCQLFEARKAAVLLKGQSTAKLFVGRQTKNFALLVDREETVTV
jgi:hypothetical protein